MTDSERLTHALGMLERKQAEVDKLAAALRNARRYVEYHCGEIWLRKVLSQIDQALEGIP